MKRLTLNKVEEIFLELNYVPHYLMYKPISKWDKYDKSNWNNIIKNTKYEKLYKRK